MTLVLWCLIFLFFFFHYCKVIFVCAMQLKNVQGFTDLNLVQFCLINIKKGWINCCLTSYFSFFSQHHIKSFHIWDPSLRAPLPPGVPVRGICSARSAPLVRLCPASLGGWARKISCIHPCMHIIYIQNIIFVTSEPGLSSHSINNWINNVRHRTCFSKSPLSTGIWLSLSPTPNNLVYYLTVRCL